MAKDDKKDKDAGKPAAAIKKPEGKVVQVRATKLGFYGHMLRPVGKVFNVTLRAGEKMPSWVEVVGEEPDAGEKTDEPTSAASAEQKGSSADDVL